MAARFLPHITVYLARKIETALQIKMQMYRALQLTLNWTLNNGSAIPFLIIWGKRLMKSVRLQKHNSIPSGSLATLIYALPNGGKRLATYIFSVKNETGEQNRTQQEIIMVFVRETCCTFDVNAGKDRRVPWRSWLWIMSLAQFALCLWTGRGRGCTVCSYVHIKCANNTCAAELVCRLLGA